MALLDILKRQEVYQKALKKVEEKKATPVVQKPAYKSYDEVLKSTVEDKTGKPLSPVQTGVGAVMEIKRKQEEQKKTEPTPIQKIAKIPTTISTLTPIQSAEGQSRAIEKGVTPGLQAKLNMWKDLLSVYGQKAQEAIEPIAELGQGISGILAEQKHPILSRAVGMATSATTTPGLQTAQGMQALGKGNIVEGATGLVFGGLSAVAPSAMAFNAVMGTPEAQATIGKALEVWDTATQRTIYKILPKEAADAVKLGLELYIFKKFDEGMKLPFKTKKKVTVQTPEGVKEIEVPTDREWFSKLKEDIATTTNKFVADPMKFLNEMPMGLSIKDVSKEKTSPEVKAEERKPIEIIPPKVTPVPAETKGVSKIGQSVSEGAVKEKLTKAFEDTAEYTKITIEDQAKRATELITNDIEGAKKILEGSKPLPEGLRGASLITALEDYAIKNKDVKLLQDIANSPLVSETSVHAQEMRLMAERNPDSPIAAIKTIKDIREAKAKRMIQSQKIDVYSDIKDTIKDLDKEMNAMIKEGKKVEANAIKEQINDLRKEIKSQAKMTAKEAKEIIVKTVKAQIQRTAPKVSDWSSFVDSITC